MSRRFEGRRAVITGAGSGVGRASLRRFASEGAEVLALDFEQERLREACGSLPRVSSRCVDVRDAAALDALASFDPDVLVNAAGVIRRHEVLEHPLDAWEETMDVNLKAAFRLSREFAATHVSGPSRGTIVNVCSIEAFTGAPRHAAYTASKAGVAMLTKAFALELAQHRVRVNAIAPGVTETPMNEAVRRDPEWSEWLLGQIPMGRFANPDEQAAAIAYLASDHASYITGVVLPVDGGWLTA